MTRTVTLPPRTPDAAYDGRPSAAIPCDALVWAGSGWRPCRADAVLRLDALPGVNLCTAHALRADVLELPARPDCDCSCHPDGDGCHVCRPVHLGEEA